MLRLQAGLATAVLGGDPDPHFTEAAEHASKLAGAEPGTPLLRNPTFGHANVQLWRLSAAMERRDAEQVLALASTLAPADLPSVGRRAQYFIEVGRTHCAEITGSRCMRCCAPSTPHHKRSATWVTSVKSSAI